MEDSQPERPVQPEDRYIIEMLMSMRASMEEGQKRMMELLKEDNRFLKEGLKSTDQKMEIMNKKMDETSRSNKEDNRIL